MIRPCKPAFALAAIVTLASVTLVSTTSAIGATTTNLVVNTISPVYDANNVVGAPLDAAPGFTSGSLASNGVAKTDMYFTPAGLFGGAVTLGDIKSIHYWTKTGSTHDMDPSDWFLTIYTAPYPGDVSTPGWYGDRIGSEPYFSAAISDPANTWNEWTTDGAVNKLRFFESTAGAPGASFGSYSDPDWATFSMQNALSGSPYAGHSILFFSVQTATSWAAGFTGQLDGMTIELNDGSVARINFEDTCLADADCETDALFCTYDTCHVSDGICQSTPRNCSADSSSIDFETPLYTLGSINGQDGWVKTGPYDHAVSDSAGTFGFGMQSLRISNAVTSGSFGDQTFSKPLANEVGEATAANAGFSGGSRRTHFEARFDLASATPGAEQAGLVMSTSADRGDGSPMTNLRFEDSATGLHAYFIDYQDVAPFGEVGTEADGCGVGDDFVETHVGTDLDRSVPHTFLTTLDTIDGPHNDVVTFSIDGSIVHTGTSWEDYARWCLASGSSNTVDSMLFRTSGTAVPATAGFGFLIDNLELTSGTVEGSLCNDTCNDVTDSCQTPVTTACTDDFNPCTVDQCDGSGSCTHVAGNAGSICRAAVGGCDAAETCDGASTVCPVDGVLPAMTQCRAASGVCDAAETCDGSTDACPVDVFAASTATCRVAAGTCDIAETCSGSTPECPADAKSMGMCRAMTDVCDIAETCDGMTDDCPVDAKSTALCRAASGDCDVAETCDGVGSTCPIDAFVASSTACTADAEMCTTDICDGAGSCAHVATPACTGLQPTRVRINRQSAGDSRGKISAAASFTTAPPDDALDASNPITLTIADSLTTSAAHTWTVAECRRNRSGVIKCVSGDRLSKLAFLPVSGQPGAFKLQARFKRLAIDAPFSGPVGLTLQYGAAATTRAGQIASCTTENYGLKCQ